MLSTSVMYAIGNDIAKLVRMVLESNVGINQKVGKNTLKGSNLYNQLSVYATNDGDLVFDLLLNDYLVYIESGRRKGAKLPPVEPIVRWAREKGISTDDRTIWAIRKAISRDGIEPRPFMSYVFDEIDKEWNDAWGDMLFNKIMETIDNFFKK